MSSPTPEQAHLFRRQGYAVFPNWLTNDELSLLQTTCDALMSEPVDDDKGGTAHNIGRGHDRRFLRHRHADFPALATFILGDRMKAFVTPLLGPQPTLFNEQFVVKGPKTGAAFAWHQDSGYVGFDHAPYLSVWVAVDDTTLDNGPVYLLPRDLDQQTDVADHNWDSDGKEMVGYDGEELGTPAIVPAGSIVAFSSLTLHRSSPNTSDAARRAYLVQYSNGPILIPETGQPKTFAIAL